MPLTRHHIVPRSKGGGNEESNIQMACRPCHDELDLKAGVRLKRALDYRKKRNQKDKARKQRKRAAKTNRCVKCNNTCQKTLQLGIMQASAAVGLCQRCAWQRERELWHSLRESIARKSIPMPEVDDGEIDRMLRKARSG